MAKFANCPKRPLSDVQIEQQTFGRVGVSRLWPNSAVQRKALNNQLLTVRFQISFAAHQSGFAESRESRPVGPTCFTSATGGGIFPLATAGEAMLPARFHLLDIVDLEE